MAATLVFRLTGGASNSDPDASLGGVMSSTEISGTALNNLFDDVSPDEATSGSTEYRMIDIYNSGDAEATSVELYTDPNTSSTDTSLELGHDATNNPHTAGADLETLANETTVPASPVIAFAVHDSGSKLTIPNIPSGQAARVSVKRIVSAGATNTSSDSATLKVQFA
jgi:hypothetical protein